MYPPRDMKNPKNVMREASWWLEVYSGAHLHGWMVAQRDLTSSVWLRHTPPQPVASAITMYFPFHHKWTVWSLKKRSIPWHRYRLGARRYSGLLAGRKSGGQKVFWVHCTKGGVVLNRSPLHQCS